MLSALIAVALLSLVSGQESQKFQSHSTDGRFALSGSWVNETGAEFWLCVDYDSAAHPPPPSSRAPPLVPTPYPVAQCGGSRRAREPFYWYALHGRWSKHSEAKLSVTFESAFQCWAEYGTFIPQGIGSGYPWVRHRALGQSKWQLNQVHNTTNFGETIDNIGTLDLVGFGSVHVWGPRSPATVAFVRLRGTGIRLDTLQG